jgi:regulator of sirC expression with transglutaminase-like and TPR domain
VAGWLALALLVVISTLASAADRGAVPRKPVPNREPPARPEQSVEALARLARPGVVVITQFGREGREEGVGAGFVVSSNGLVATSLHVIGEARRFAVRLADGRPREVTHVHAFDRKLDLAIIRVEGDNLPALPLGDSDTLKQGASVVAMGNPLGLDYSVVQGVVSARRDFDGVEMIQLAIPVEPGNSGGPVLDRQGRVQGILAMKAALTPNLGFALPVNALKPLLDKPNPVAMSRWLTLGALNEREWTPLFGARWSQRGGGIQAEAPGSGFGGRSLCLFRQTPPTAPYELAVSVRLEDEAGAAGLVFDSDGGDKHYGFYPSAGQMRLTRFDGPTVYSWTILRQVPTPHYRPGEWNQLKVRREEDRILCYLNGHLVIESTDQELPAGRVGLAKFRETRASFRNFEVGAHVATNSPAVSGAVLAEITNALRRAAGEPDASLLAALQPHAEAGRAVLAERAAELESEAARLRQLSARLNQQSVTGALTETLRGPEPSIDLFHAALLVAKLDNPDLDVPGYRRQLDDMAGELRARLTNGVDALTRLAALTNYLFLELGFHGSRHDYYNRANSYVNQVLDDREGLPITLSVVFLELGRRIGLTNLTGVALPAHFVVKFARPAGEDILLDVFDNARPLTRAGAKELVADRGGVPWQEELLVGASAREIVVRMIRNLLYIAQRQGSDHDSLRYLDVLVALLPESGLDRLARASLRVQTGDAAGAKEDFRWILDHQPAGLDLERIAAIYQSLF